MKAYLELLRMVPQETGGCLQLEPQYIWRFYPNASEILDSLEWEDI